MTSWLPDAASLKRPVFLSLAEQFAAAIEAGRLAPGERLPTHRRLAERFAISVQTASRAYEELQRRGLISGETGRGTFVRAARREPDPPYIAERAAEIIDLSMLKPVSEQMHIDRMKTALAGLAADFPPGLLTSFRPNVLFSRHREAAVGWLRHCGVETSARNVILTNGATAAMTVALMTAARPGASVATERIGHHTLLPLASYLGLNLRGIAIDAEGIVPEELDRACRDGEVRAVYLLPNAANPTAALMGAERRRAIVAVARRHDLQIIENDAWGPLLEHRAEPIAALAPERTHYLTGFSKIVAPGVRLGYLAVPDRFIPAAGNRHLVTNWMATAILAEIATRWVEDGTAMELVVWQRQALRRRQAIARELFAGIPYRAHPEGLHVWVPLDGRREDEVVSLARLQGVAIAPGASFAIEAPQRPAVRVCLGSPGEARLRAGLATVAGILHSEPEPALLTL